MNKYAIDGPKQPKFPIALIHPLGPSPGTPPHSGLIAHEDVVAPPKRALTCGKQC